MLKDKLVFVTGGSRGIGEAIVDKLSCSGANVIFTYNSNQEKAEALCERIKARGNGVHCIKLDVTNAEEVTSTLESIYNQFGVPDVLVNNAGITRDKLMVQMSYTDWFEVINTNLNSIFHITKSVAYKMLLNEKAGSIINMSSVSGIVGTMGQTNYSAAKAGLIGFTHSLAKEVGKYNIRVNAIAPGYIETDMIEDLKDKGRKEMVSRIPLRRIGRREEVADVVLFLASQMSSYVTGTTITIDGGLSS
ncbi:3-oxoacyl-[acyl-carrier-protein] reductase FabG [compost metagenome]